MVDESIVPTNITYTGFVCARGAYSALNSSIKQIDQTRRINKERFESIKRSN